jgi:deoxyribose-phosphate aldolase
MSSLPSYTDLSKMIDHSLLNPTLTVQQLENGIALAKAYDTGSVCIMPWYLKRCAQLLAGTTVQPSATIGFPHGVNITSTKVKEAQQVIADGCTELDMVVNISAVLSGKWDYVRDDIKAVIDVAHAAKRRVKVIFENCYLNRDQKIRLCEICTELKADWVKTSTGYGTGGAVDEDLTLMRQHTPTTIQVKAAGGVRTLDRMLQVRAIGCSRVGATATKVILDEARQRLSLPPIIVPAVPAV